MFPQRTRKPGIAARLAVLVGLFACAGAAQAVSGLRSVHVPTERAAGAVAAAPKTLMVSGMADEGCAPEIGSVSVAGNDVDIALVAPRTGCGRTSASFHLRVDIAARSGVPLQAGRVYRVHVSDISAGTPSLLAFSLLDTSDTSTAPLPENGFWWSEADPESGPAVPGSGITTELQGQRLAVSLLGVGSSGDATWFFGTTRLGGRVARTSLVQLAGSESPSPLAGPAAPAVLQGPRLELEFASPSRARAYIVRSENGRDVDVRMLALSRSRFDSGAVAATWSGQWVLVGDEGSVPRVFEFSEARSRDAEAFRLEDAGKDAVLDCRLAAGTDHPDLCTLSSASLRLGDFDQIGLDHLAGQGGSGGRVQLLRVPR